MIDIFWRPRLRGRFRERASWTRSWRCRSAFVKEPFGFLDSVVLRG